jgi:3-phenylpropionate/trans-cinnamate dioxygenase ferredoxin reductase component
VTQRHYPYLIIGGGMTADAAVRGIRQVDAEGVIGLIGAEPDPPYNRPPLTKALWKTGPRPMPLSRIWRGTTNLGVELHLGRQVVALDGAAKRVRDHLGDEYTFGRLLLATGGEPIRLGIEHERILYYRTLADYQRLRSLAANSQHFVVIGGGFIGSEIAAALANQGKNVTMVFPEPGIGARVLPADISVFLNETFRQHGVHILDGQLVKSLHPDEQGVTLTTDRGETLRAECVVAGLGIRPNIDLAQSAGLETGNGILVDRYLRTSTADIFAAGDVANFYNPLLDQRLRVEHEENANMGGLTAGQNMAGKQVSYDLLPAVYSTLFDVSYDAVGELDPRLEILYDWQEPLQKGTAYYLKEGRVRGVLLWNLSHGLERARELIAATGPLTKDGLRGYMQR